MRWIAFLSVPFRRLALWVLLLIAAAPSSVLAMDGDSGFTQGPARYESPADQPSVPSGDAEIPAAPASFNTYEGGWIRFSYPPATRERLEPLIQDANRFRSEMQARLGATVLENVTVYVARTPGEMSTLAPEGAPYPRYASGVAYSRLGLILLTLTPKHSNAAHDLGEIFRHELGHVALFDAVGGAAVPRWFNEGFAVHVSGESSLARLQTLWTATLAGDLIPLARLDRSFPADSVDASLAYAESADVVRYLLRQQDRERFPAFVDRIREGQPFEAALSDAYGVGMDNLEYEWREAVAKRYSFWPVFFSGSVVWIGALGLFVVGYRRRRKRAEQTLARWSREEAREAAARRSALEPGGRVHIVLPSSSGEGPPELPAPALPRPSASDGGDVPKVEHEGQWHTLH